MTALSIQPPFPIFTDIDGQPLEAGYIFIGIANLQPIGNPVAVYWDAALTQPAAQPIRTIGGYPANNGTPARLYVNSDYSIQVQNRNGSVVYSAPAATERYSGEVIEITFNDVTGQLGSDRVNFLQAGTGAVTRTAQAKMRDVVSVKDFGAVGNNVADDTTAIQAALTYAGTLGGAEVFFPSGNYKAGKLTIPSNVTLRGQTSLQGGSANLYATGTHVFATPSGSGFHFFNLYNLTVWGDRVDTDFLDQSGGGSWAYSTVANCYIVNIRNFHTLTTGNHFLNNNFQNIVSMEIRGGDYTICDNYIAYDDADVTKGASDALVGIIASTGVDFSRNYITSMKASNAPIPLKVENSVDVRLLSNWIDGGKDHALVISAGGYRISANFNRFGVIYPATCVPVLLSNVTDVNVNENQFNNLSASAAFITFASTLARCNVLNNITNSRTDSTTHDYASATSVSRVRMVGEYLSVKDIAASQDIFPPLYGRTLINQSASALVFFYVYSTKFIAGDYFNFSRTNTSQRLIVRDVDTSTNLYDSNTSGFNTGRIISYVSGVLTVEQTV